MRRYDSNTSLIKPVNDSRSASLRCKSYVCAISRNCSIVGFAGMCFSFPLWKVTKYGLIPAAANGNKAIVIATTYERGDCLKRVISWLDRSTPFGGLNNLSQRWANYSKKH